MATVQHTQVVVPAPPGPFDPAIPQDAILRERVEQLIDYIMKNCLWQFHSRRWDRVRQNENILGMTGQDPGGETGRPVRPVRPLLLRRRLPPGRELPQALRLDARADDDEIREVIAATKARLDCPDHHRIAQRRAH